MNKTFDGKKLMKGIYAVILYFVLTIAFQIPFIFLIKKKLISNEVATLIAYFAVVLVFIFIFRKELIKDFKDFKKNNKKIISTSIKYWIIGFIIMYISSIIINILPINPNTNQETNIALLKSKPIIEILLACIIAPALEEIVYRLSFKGFTKNKWIFAISTGLLFAGIHIITSINGIKDLVMLIYLVPYGALGITFGLAYFETDNIYGTLCVHSLHNLISILELLLIGGIIL